MPTPRTDWPPRRVADGLYQSPNGSFWIRPYLDGRLTWKKLASIGFREAQKEGRAIKTDYERSKLGLCEDPLSAPPGTLTALAERYLKAGCPNGRLEERPQRFVDLEKSRLRWITEFFGRTEPGEIKLKDLPEYAKWRMHRCQKGSGHRTVEMDWVTLSNVLNYGVSTGHLDFNFIGQKRPRLRLSNPRPGSTAKKIRHSRETAPASGDELHRIAGFFLASSKRESIGWLVLFAALTGCRKSELLQLRIDAKTPEQPGYCDGSYLFLRRSKAGINPYVMVHPALAECLAAHRRWHANRYSNSPWFFPGRDPQHPLTLCAVNHALQDACATLSLPPRTAHGLRAFYATKRRSDGATDVQIAAEMGDRTVGVIHVHYADRPANWTGGDKVDWIPASGEPAWKAFSSANSGELKPSDQKSEGCLQ